MKSKKIWKKISTKCYAKIENEDHKLLAKSKLIAIKKLASAHDQRAHNHVFKQLRTSGNNLIRRG